MNRESERGRFGNETGGEGSRKTGGGWNKISQGRPRQYDL